MENRLKMYCVFSKESLQLMKGIRGKMTSQAGHAFLHSFWNAEKLFFNDAQAYRNNPHAYKISLVVNTTAELISLADEYKLICGTSLVKDAGFTVFSEPTITCVGIGPLYDSKKTDTLKNAKLLT